jgi:hypothetical protein
LATLYRRLTAKARAARIRSAFDKAAPSMATAIWKATPQSHRQRILSRLAPERRQVLVAATQAFTLSGLDEIHRTSSERRAARLVGKATVTSIRTHKFRLYPTSKQTRFLDSVSAAVRAIYNAENELYRQRGHSASLRWEKGDATRGIAPSRAATAIDPAIFFPSGKLASRELRAANPTTAWLNDAPASAFVSARAHLELAWVAYAKRCAARGSPRLTTRRGKLIDDRPRFRNQIDHTSFELPVWTQGASKGSCNVLLNHRGVRLPKLTAAAAHREAGPGWIKLRRHARIEGQTKTAIIKREGNRWFLCLVVERRVLPDPHLTSQLA